jgi:RNA polymerase sigma factor (sigma-70 family)
MRKPTSKSRDRPHRPNEGRRGERKSDRGQLACPESVLRDLDGLCRQIARDYHAPGMARDDFCQEARLALCRAWETHQPDRGTTLAQYAAEVIRNGLRDAKKTAERLKHRPLNDALSLDVILDERRKDEGT